MLVHFDYDGIKKILSDFYTLTNASICFFNSDYEPILAYPNTTPKLCQLIKSTKKGNMMCIQSDIDGCKKAKELLRPVTYKCPAGLMDTVTPIICNDTIIGYIMFGQIADKSIEQNALLELVIKNISPYGISVDEIKSAFGELLSFDTKHVEAASNILAACAGYIHLSNMIKIEKNLLSEKVIKHVETHFRESLSIHELCNSFFISKNKLYDIFSELCNTTPLKYQLSLRIKESKKLLTTTSMSITEISDWLGFSSYNHFSKLFKSETGITPSKYRK